MMLAFLAVPLLALVAAQEAPPLDERCSRSVVVEEGDTCDFICTCSGEEVARDRSGVANGGGADLLGNVTDGPS